MAAQRALVDCLLLYGVLCSSGGAASWTNGRLVGRVIRSLNSYDHQGQPWLRRNTEEGSAEEWTFKSEKPLIYYAQGDLQKRNVNDGYDRQGQPWSRRKREVKNSEEYSSEEWTFNPNKPLRYYANSDLPKYKKRGVFFHGDMSSTATEKDVFRAENPQGDYSSLGRNRRTRSTDGGSTEERTFKPNKLFKYYANSDLPKYKKSGVFVHDMSSSTTEEEPIRVELPEEDPRAGTAEYISDHEQPREVATRPKYGLVGGWSKGQLPDKKVELGFVPLQIYSQTRNYDTEKHLPRKAALEEAASEEELLAAPRLREVRKDKKLHEVYEEEGYEDAGYDHAGYNHHGAKVEGLDKDEETVFKEKSLSKYPHEEKRVSQSEASTASAAASEDSIGTGNEEMDKRSESSVLLDNTTPKVEVKNGRVIVDGRSVPILKNSLKDTAVRQNLTIHVPDDLTDRMDISESRPENGETEARIMSDPRPKVTFPGRSTRRHYTQWSPILLRHDGYIQAPSAPRHVVNIHRVAPYLPSPYYRPAPKTSTDTPVDPAQFASTINTYASLINQNFSSPLTRQPIYSEPDYSIKDEFAWAPSNVHEKKVKSDAPYEKTEESSTPFNAELVHITTETPRRQTARDRGRRKGNRNGNSNLHNIPQVELEENPIDSKHLDAAAKDTTRTTSTINGNKKTYSNFTRGSVKYNPEVESESIPKGGSNIRHPSKSIDTSSNPEHESKKKDQQVRPPQATVQQKTSKEKTVQGLHQANHDDSSLTSRRQPPHGPDSNAKYVEQLTLAHFSASANIPSQKPPLQSQNERLIELAKHLNAAKEEGYAMLNRRKRKRRSSPYYDKELYPHYERPSSISKESALKYATNRRVVPKKSFGGMEFYESRDKMPCSGPYPPKNIAPKRGEDGEWNENPQPDGPRLQRLGNTIDCYKKKYFGRDPLDNPLFKEEDIGTVNSDDSISDIEKKIPFRDRRQPERNRRIMIVENSKFYPNVSQGSESMVHPVVSKGPTRRIPIEEISITTSRPYTFQEETKYPFEESPENSIQNVYPPTSNIVKYYLQPTRYIATNKNKRKKHVSQMPRVIVYSIKSKKKIPPHHASLLLAHSVETPKVIISRGVKDSLASASNDRIQGSTGPKYYIIRPGEYTQNKSLLKRDSDSMLWNMVSPLRWWFPSLFDYRRDEPRYRRSAHGKRASIEEKMDLLGQSDEKDDVSKFAPKVPEFKAKTNGADNSKLRVTRLTGGFLNRNTDMVDSLGTVQEPTEASTRSTLATTTVKPKVIFPRVKLPGRKTFSPKKLGSYSTDYSTTTEALTTTTTTPLPPPTTTRMYKPKRVLKRNDGKASIDVFTILKNQKDETTQVSEEEKENIGHTIMKSGKNEKQKPNGVSPKLPDENNNTEKRSLKTDTSEEEGLESSRSVSGTGEDSGGEQRRWKPKRKRPERSKSIYAIRFEEQTKPSKKKQRDLSRLNTQEAYVQLMRQLPPVSRRKKGATPGLTSSSLVDIQRDDITETREISEETTQEASNDNRDHEAEKNTKETVEETSRSKSAEGSTDTETSGEEAEETTAEKKTKETVEETSRSNSAEGSTDTETSGEEAEEITAEKNKDKSGEETSAEKSSVKAAEEKPTSSRPPPKFILDPDKRRYYYAKL